MTTPSRYGFGDVLLVPFPFTDQTGTKKRPAVVVSSHGYNASRRDIVIMAITSQIRALPSFGEALLADWQGAGLIKASVLKPVFTTLEQGLVLRTMGHLSGADVETLRRIVADVFGRTQVEPSSEPT